MPKPLEKAWSSGLSFLFLLVKKLVTDFLPNGYPGNWVISSKGFNGNELETIVRIFSGNGIKC